MPRPRSADLPRARVEGHVPGVALPVGQQPQAAGAGAEGMGDARARRAGDDAALADRVLVVAEQDRPSPRATTNSSSSALWQCGGPLSAPGSTSMTLRPASDGPERAARVAQVGVATSPSPSARPRASSIATIVGGRSGLGRRELERARRVLGRERVRARRAAPSAARPRTSPARGSHVRPVGEPEPKARTSSPSVAAPTIVCAAPPARCRTTSPAATAQVRPSCQLSPDAGQHDEQLLLVGVDVDRHGPLARPEPVAAEPDARAARDRAHAPARAAQDRAVDGLRGDVVEVHDHGARS